MNSIELKYAVLFCDKCQNLLERKLSDVIENLAALQNSASANITDLFRLREDEWRLNLNIFFVRLASAYLENLIENCEV